MADREADRMRNDENFRVAILSNQTRRLESLLKKSSRDININQLITDDCTGLHLAIKQENVSMFELLMRYGANAKAKTKEGNGCLHLAAEAIDTEMLMELLKTGVRVNDSNTLKSTPLHLAVSRGRFSSVLLLLNNKANVNAQNLRGETPLFVAVEKNDLGLINCLLEHGANPNQTNGEGYSAFHKSFSLRDENVINSFLNHNASVVLKSVEGNNALHLAARYGLPRIVKKLLEMKMNCNEKNFYRDTPLHVVLKYNEDSKDMVLSMVKLLVSHGTDVNLVDKWKQAPLFYAVRNGDLRTVKYLVESGARIDGNGNERSIFEALKNNNIEMIKFLIVSGAKVNVVREDGKTPLHLAILSIFNESSRLEVIKLLLDRGINVDRRDGDKETALQVALRHTDLQVFELLIERGALVTTRNNHLESPLFTAVAGLMFGAAVRLIELGASVNDCDSNKLSILRMAIATHHPKMVNVLLDHGADANDRSALVEAARLNDVKTMETLVSYGAVIDSKRSPLAHKIFFEAARHGNAKMVRHLLSNGADVNMLHNDTLLLDLLIKGYVNLGRRNVTKLLVRHVALLLSLDKPVRYSNVQLIKSVDWILHYFNVCKQEITIMRKTRIYADSNFTYFDVLKKQRNTLANCLRDEYVNVRLKNGFYPVLFPNYSSYLREKYLYGQQRLRLVDDFQGMLSDVLGNALTCDLIVQISEYFSNEELCACL